MIIISWRITRVSIKNVNSIITLYGVPVPFYKNIYSPFILFLYSLFLFQTILIDLTILHLLNEKTCGHLSNTYSSSNVEASILEFTKYPTLIDCSNDLLVLTEYETQIDVDLPPYERFINPKYSWFNVTKQPQKYP